MLVNDTARDIEDAIDEYERLEIEDEGHILHQQCVYFVRAHRCDGELSDYVKIGYTNNLARRMEQLQASSPFQLSILHVVYADDAYSIEQRYHQLLRKYRRHHEWFQIPEVMMKDLEDATVEFSMVRRKEGMSD